MPKQPAAMINIGAEREAVAEVRGAIMDILNSGAEQETLRVALDVLKTAANINNVSVTNCTFTTGDKK